MYPSLAKHNDSGYREMADTIDLNMPCRLNLSDNESGALLPASDLLKSL